MAYRAILHGVLGALFYWFFAVFPERSPLDSRVPWLKWAAPALGICFAVPGLRSGSIQPPSWLQNWLGDRIGGKLMTAYSYALVTLGLICLAANYLRTADKE